MALATRLQHSNNASNTIGYEGFSWTCLFFGPFPALFRGDLIGFLAMVATAIPTAGFAGIVWMFVYNRWHYSRLISRGYQPAGGVSLSQTINIASFAGSREAENDFEPRFRQAETPISRSPSPTLQIATRGPKVSFGRR